MKPLDEKSFVRWLEGEIKEAVDSEDLNSSDYDLGLHDGFINGLNCVRDYFFGRSPK